MATTKTVPYVVLDVFTDTPFAGNQLGVVILSPEGGSITGDGSARASSPSPTVSLTQNQKQKIAREFNFSETIFIHPYDTSTSTRRVDIFTKRMEIPFAGHPTIGAVSYILGHMSPEKDQREVVRRSRLQLKAGIVVGSLDTTTGFASAEIPHNVHVHAYEMTWDRVMGSQTALRAHEPSIGEEVKAVKHSTVSIVKGMTFSLVDLSAQPELLAKLTLTNSCVTTPDDLDEDWNETLLGNLFFVVRPSSSSSSAPDGDDETIRVDQRVFVIGLEDPATGSASAALCSSLALKKGGAGKTYKFQLEQGTHMGRRSIIGCEVTLNESGKEVSRVVLSGQTRQTMRGELQMDQED